MLSVDMYTLYLCFILGYRHSCIQTYLHRADSLSGERILSVKSLWEGTGSWGNCVLTQFLGLAFVRKIWLNCLRKCGVACVDT